VVSLRISGGWFVATVLLVDDVASSREIVATLLGYRGHRVLEAGEAAEAISVARREHPDIVVTDVLMPGMDGYELARRLRRDPETARTALVFYSANYTEDELRPIMDSSGASRVVSKAAGPQRLLDAVEEVLCEPAPAPATDDDLSHARLVNAKLVEKTHLLDVSQRNFRLMAESSPVGVFLIDRDANASYVNERLCAIVGSPAGELVGRGWLRIFPPELHPEVLDTTRAGERGYR
jgi:CheY-like chemotaxis protein